jgi:hypothetical protein
VTLIEHGGLTALQDTYVRALASRYGNPNDILRRDYVTAMPGINMPGSYEQYASNPEPTGSNGRRASSPASMSISSRDRADRGRTQ